MKVANHIRILYAEDNEDACFMLSTLLGISGIDVFIAHNIKDAFWAAQKEHFDVYLLDGGFADGSGLELCRKLHEFNPMTPIAFYSGRAYETDKQKGFAAGANAYLVKPEIESVVPALLRLAAQTSEIKRYAGGESWVSPAYRQVPISPNAVALAVSVREKEGIASAPANCRKSWDIGMFQQRHIDL